MCKQLGFYPTLSNVLTRCFFMYNYNIFLIQNQVNADFMRFLHV
nr:MAG TPA: Helper component proteinase [Caudoviricetes sp.]